MEDDHIEEVQLDLEVEEPLAPEPEPEAATETDPAECFVKRIRIRPRQFGEHLPLGLSRQVRTGRGARHVETGKANGGGHGSGHLFQSIRRRGEPRARRRLCRPTWSV